MVEKVVIIGSGPAGWTAALYLARAKLDPFVYEGADMGGAPGGQLMTTTEIENFPGFPDGIMGPELMERMKQQALRFGTRSEMLDVSEVDFSTRPFRLKSEYDEREAHTVIVATGALARRLELESEQRFWMKGISACAVCDGANPMFRDKVLMVIGGGDSAVEEADHLTQFASKVYLVHRRDELRASKIMQQRALNHPKISIIWDSVVEEFLGDKFLSGVQLKNVKTGQLTEMEVSGAFEAIGHTPNTKIFQGQLAMDDTGYLVCSPNSSKTSVDGVFAGGDVRDAVYRQAVTAAGTGCMAALECERWLQAQNIA